MRDQSFEPNYSIIGQYLSNTNESATVSILQKILELNKANVPIQFCKKFRTKIFWACLLPKCKIAKKMYFVQNILELNKTLISRVVRVFFHVVSLMSRINLIILL